MVAVDLRDPARPVLRMGLTAQNTVRRALGMNPLGPDGVEIEPEEGARVGAAAPAGTGKGKAATAAKGPAKGKATTKAKASGGKTGKAAAAPAPKGRG